MIKLEEDRSSEIAIALRNALNTNHILDNISAIFTDSLSEGQTKRLIKAINEKKKITFSLGNLSKKTLYPRYNVLIDFATKEIVVEINQTANDLWANKFKVV